MKKHFIRLATAATAAATMLATRAFAADTLNPTGAPKSVYGVLNSVINTIVAVAGLIFVIIMVVGGIQYLSSAGNDDGLTKSKKMMVNGVIGLVIVLVAYAASRWVLTSLGVSIPATI